MIKCTYIERGFMNTSNIANYKPKDFAELLGVSVKTLQHCNTATLGQGRYIKSKPHS